MNATESNKSFLPKQAMQPTPEHYNALTGDGMEKLAQASLSQIPDIPPGALVHDNGCGTGAATAAIMAAITPEAAATINIKGTDIVRAAVDSYVARAESSSWPAQGSTMDANSLSFPDQTFTHTIGSALLFAGPSNNGIEAVKEMHRTLKNDGILVVNSFAFLPNIEPLRKASQETRPPGAPELRQGVDQWADPSFLASIVEAGGFEKNRISVRQCDYSITTTEFHQYSTLLWSFVGGTTAAGWTEADEERWDDAVEVVKRELRKTDGFKLLDDGRAVLKFVANVAVATK
jgi:ubiquinone/menaquinone biosynthesis C-methylase UbiE